jgi:predicted GIY-YIG superfamily endonuclease
MTKSIAHKRPVKIIFQQEFQNEALARRVEYKLKKLKSRKIIMGIVRNGEIDTSRLLGSESNKILGG